MEYYTKVAIDCQTDCEVNSYKIRDDLYVITKNSHDEEPFYEIHLSDNGVYSNEPCDCWCDELNPLVYHYKLCETSYIGSVYTDYDVVDKLLNLFYKHFVVDGRDSINRCDYDDYLSETIVC